MNHIIFRGEQHCHPVHSAHTPNKYTVTQIPLWRLNINSIRSGWRLGWCCKNEDIAAVKGKATSTQIQVKTDFKSQQVGAACRKSYYHWTSRPSTNSASSSFVRIRHHSDHRCLEVWAIYPKHLYSVGRWYRSNRFKPEFRSGRRQ